ncbi:MAG: CAP domain-containing protein [Butyrivibrio sp.]|nr:CAP domain-containing protein [Butyrivibrio sp.]
MKRMIGVMIAATLLGILARPVEVKAASEDDVLSLMNAARQEAGLSAYTLDSELSKAAQTRAEECSTRFSHTRPNGKAWSTVSASTNGENLAHAVNSTQSKPENVVTAWLLSPTHKANVLRNTFSSVGIAYFKGDDGQTYIVCEFK